jgi:RNA polymerase sigma-54 factor
MRQDQSLRQSVRQKADFRLIAANQVLQKGSLTLRQLIQEELSSNPALELATDMLCPSCGFPLTQGKCRFCDGLLGMSAESKESLEPPPVSSSFEKWKDKGTGEQGEIGEIAAPVSLADHLREQARSYLPAEDHAIADYLIANIGDKGLLECDPSEVCDELGLSLEHLKRVLSVLQSLDPPGVGAASSQEALLIQIRQLAKEGEVDPWAEKIVHSCWEDLAFHRYQRIADFLGCKVEDVRKSAEFIRDNLNPYPASAFNEQNRPDAEAIRWPDVVIHREKADYEVEVIESYESELRISDSFLRLRGALAKTRSPSEDTVVALEALRRACFFLACLRMRKKTLQEVAECVVRLQRGYLDTGMEEHLRPLTRAKVAALLGKHESTVSRAVSDKFVLLPSQQLIPFERFFSPSAAPKRIILELISREGEKPLTDRQISRILESRGYRVARRTVAKYRQALRIPSSAQRRTS